MKKQFRLRAERVDSSTQVLGYYETTESANEAFHRMLKRERLAGGLVSTAKITLEKRTGNEKHGSKIMGTWKEIKLLKGYRRDRVYYLGWGEYRTKKAAFK